MFGGLQHSLQYPGHAQHHFGQGGFPPSMVGGGLGMSAGMPNHAPVAQQPAGTGPSQPLTMIAPANAFSGEAGRYSWCRVAYAGGVDLRQGPSVEAPKTGETLCQNATFAAAEEILGQDSRIYLRLADGRGWAFDDSGIFPDDPSIMRGYWQPVGPAPPQGGAAQAAAPTAPAGGMPGGGMHGGAMGGLPPMGGLVGGQPPVW